MTNPIQKAITSASKGDAELRRSDRREVRDYLPMNVFVDPATMKAQFQGSVIHDRWAVIRSVT